MVERLDPNSPSPSSPQPHPPPPPPRKPLAATAKDLRNKVRAQLSSLTPYENIYTLPNLLTFSRLLAAPVIGYLVLHDQHVWAVGLFAYAGITDLVDGWIARRWKLQTVVGSVVDPMADKILMTVLTVCLAVKGALPVWLATLILGRDVSLAIAAIYYRYVSLPRPVTFARYWDFSLPSAIVHPTGVSKLNTFLQLALIGATTALPLLEAGTTADLAKGMRAFQGLVAATTAWSGMSYTWTRKAVEIIGREGMGKAERGRLGRNGRVLIGVCFGGCIGVAAWAGRREERGAGGEGRR